MRLIRALALLASPAMAAESSYSDAAAKIAAILAEPAVAKAVHQAPIGAIRNVGTAADGADLWQVTVQECDLTVRVLGHPPKGAGSATYTVELDGLCR